ncbi:MAG: ABC transporter ATP-binding protein [Treponemataceae bacterium]
MPEFYEADEATKEYDSRLFNRIISYIRPYKVLVALTAIALAVSTTGELYVPILIRSVLDEAVFSSWRSTDAPELVLSKGVITVETASGVRYFVPKSALSALSRTEEKRLIESSQLSADDWYSFNCAAGSAKYDIATARKEIFLLSLPREDHGTIVFDTAVRMDDLRLLSLTEKRTIRSGDYEKIARSIFLFVLILLAVLVATFTQSYTAGLIGQRVMTDIRLSLFAHICSQSLSFLSRHPIGRLVTRMTSDVETINDFFTSVLVSFLKDVSLMIGVLIALFSLSPRLALVTVCTLPPVFLVTLVSRVKARDAFRRQRSSVSRVNSYLAERISGFHVVQLFSKEKGSAAEFAERDKALLDANLAEMYVFASFRPLVDFLSALTTAVVIGTGAYFYLSSMITLGVLIAFVSLIAMFYAPVQDISEKYTMLQSAMAGSERIFKLLDTNEQITDATNPVPMETIRGHIEFKSVRFSYKKDEEILKGLSFAVRPGETVAIVGYTGAGKTTITNLMARLWDVIEGEILIDGVPVKDMSLSLLRKSVLPVLQDVFLFSGTVAENIRLGLPMSDTEVVAAAKAVHADEFISRLPNGYQTILSEGATNISSGQRQLISFARVVAHDPRIVILDEATSSIDTETERLIQKGLERVLKGRTAVVIAHRMSTIRHADRILVLSGGRIIEDGAHAALMERDGMYAKLFRLQYEHLGA